MRPYSYLMTASATDAGHYVELPEGKFLELLKYLLAQVEVDEEWYRSSYRDVDDAINAGEVKSAKDHYMTAGYFENRFPHAIKVDERWYVEEYPDVASAIQQGAFSSASQHFQKDGFKEGRLPTPNWSLIGLSC